MNIFRKIKQVESKTPALAIILWLLSPFGAALVGAYVYGALLEFAQLEVYHEEDYVAAAGLLGALVCLSVYCFLWPLVRFGFPSLRSKLSVWHWLLAAYLLPIPAVLLLVTYDGLPWSQRLTTP